MSGERFAAAALVAVTLALAGASPAQAGNGCGPAGFGFAVPDRPLGFDFHGACEHHDDCYVTAGADKLGCDAAFLWDLDDACVIADRSVSLCLRIALGYYRAVRSWIGDVAFAHAQR